MFERFTDRARKVLALAYQEAVDLHHEYIGTEHILLGLVREEMGVAASVLRDRGVDLSAVRSEVEKAVAREPGSLQQLPVTPSTPKKAVSYAIEEARALRHSYVGTEHLLLGLLRERDTAAVQILGKLGLKLDEVREDVIDRLGMGAEVWEEVAEYAEGMGVAQGPVREDIAKPQPLAGLSGETVAMLSRAAGLAGSAGAQQVVPFHVLLAMIDDMEIAAILMESSDGFSINTLRRKLERRLSVK
jgi:ATP-dependent Clp protease ATP-binding subunit ClpA